MSSMTHTSADQRGFDQRGFALLVTLALILLTSVTVASLFGLMFLTMKVTASSEQEGREARSADAALEAAIVQMRHAPDSCVEASQLIIDGHTFDQGTPAISDDVDVSVECQPAGGAAGSTDRVRIVGADGYSGAVAWDLDCSADLALPGCTPWTNLMGSVPFGLGTSRPGIVHTGPEPLKFASGVTVRTGTAALGSNAAGTDPAKPALSVTGQYVQGSPGLVTIEGDDPGPTACGILAVSGTASFIDDGDGAPRCDDSGARAVADDPTEGEIEAGLIASGVEPPLPSCSGAVVTFQPGTYRSAAVDQMNGLLDGSNPQCRNKTFWFSPGGGTVPGIYSFDGEALNLGDAESVYVFGAPLGWDPAAGPVPAELVADRNAPLCDKETSGSTVVISARMAISHTAGRVAICPSFGPDLEPYPALYQMTSVPTRVSLVPWNYTLPRTRSYICRPQPPWWNPVDGSGRCTVPSNFDFVIDAEGRGDLRSLRVLLSGTEGDVTQNTMIDKRTVTLSLWQSGTRRCSTADMNGSPNGNFTLAYDIMSGGCATYLANKKVADLNQMVLRATIRMRLVPLLPLVWPEQALTITGVDTQVNLLDGSIDAGAVTSPQDAWTGLDNIAEADFPSGGAAATLAEPRMGSCEEAACRVALDTPTSAPKVTDHTFRYGIEIPGGFQFPGLSEFDSAGVDPTVTSLQVLVELSPGQRELPGPLRDMGWRTAYWRADMNTRLELETPGGTRCVMHVGGVNGGYADEIQRLSFRIDTVDDLENPDSCNHRIRSFEELSDPATILRLSIDMPCVRNPDPNTHWLCFQEPLENRYIWSVRPPSIDRVSVSGTTESYVGAPANSQVTIDAAGSSVGSLFRVLGRSWLPLTDLDIHWRGDPGPATLFSHDLVLHGLGSDMSIGATTNYVCCSKPDTREVRLTALVGGRERIAASVQFVDVIVTDNGDSTSTVTYFPGVTVRVLDWRRGEN